MMSFADFGNDLYSGKRTIDFVGRQKFWYAVSAVMLVLAAIGLFGRHLNLGLEFRGGSEFRVSSVTNLDNFETRGKTAIGTLDTGSDVVVTKINTDTVRVQTEKFENNLTDKVKAALASEFKVGENKITASTIGASWGASVSQKALKALIVFLVLVSLVGLFPHLEDVAGGVDRPRARPRHHRGHLCPGRLRGHAGIRDRIPHDPGLLALRHRRGLRQGP